MIRFSLQALILNGVIICLLKSVGSPNSVMALVTEIELGIFNITSLSPSSLIRIFSTALSLYSNLAKFKLFKVAACGVVENVLSNLTVTFLSAYCDLRKESNSKSELNVLSFPSILIVNIHLLIAILFYCFIWN